MARADLHINVNSLLESLKVFDEKRQKRMLSNAVTAGAKVTEKAIKGKALPISIALAASIGTKKLKPRPGSSASIIGARKGDQYKDNSTGTVPYKVAHLIEFGTQPHDVAGRAHPGATPRPFMRPAADESEARANSAMSASIQRALARAAREAARL